MNKVLLFILILPSLAFSQLTDDQQRRIWQSESIQKIIKTGVIMDSTSGVDFKVLQEIATLNDKGYVISYESFDKLDKLLSRTTYILKNDTLPIENRNISFTSGRRSVWDTNLKYNKKNQLKSAKHFIDERLVTKFTYCYHRDGTMKSQRQIHYADPRSKDINIKKESKYWYNDNKTLKHVHSKESKSGNSKSETIEYNTSKDGLLKSQYKLHRETDEKTLLRKLIYNSDHQLLEEHSFFSSPVTLWGVKYQIGDVKITKYTYHENGLISKEEHYKNENLIDIKNYIYERF